MMRTKPSSKMKWVGVVIFLAAISGENPKSLAAQPGPGAPSDLSGIYQITYGDFNPSGGPVEIPMTNWAKDMYEYNKDPRQGGENRGRFELDPRGNCFPPSVP